MGSGCLEQIHMMMSVDSYRSMERWNRANMCQLEGIATTQYGGEVMSRSTEEWNESINEMQGRGDM